MTDRALSLSEAADRISALEEAVTWAMRVPSTGDGSAAESIRVILRRAMKENK